VSGCVQDTVPIVLEDGGKICVPYSQIPALSLRIKFYGGLKGAVRQGDALGSCAVCIDNSILSHHELIAVSDVALASAFRRLFAPRTKELNFSINVVY